jgi:predicted Fe-Mo cluster-binding NifX family protein
MITIFFWYNVWHRFCYSIKTNKQIEMRKLNIMVIALSVWNDRIAPVFDVAIQLLLVEVEDGKIVKQSLEQLPSESTLEKAIMLQRLSINTLICGAVSEEVRSFLDMYGINVMAFISGNIQEILQAWLSEDFDETDFAMPGCGKQKGCGNRQRLRCRRNETNYEL